MAKTLALVIGFLFCTWVGSESARRLRTRARLLHAITIGAQKLIVSMEYAKLPIINLLCRGAYGGAQTLFDTLAQHIRAGEDALGAWLKTKDNLCREHAEYATLTDEDWSALDSFFSTIGTTDAHLHLGEFILRFADFAPFYG